MKYNVKHLAKMYSEYLLDKDFDIHLPLSQPCDLTTYNEYNYLKIMSQFDTLYYHADSLNLTEEFLKGD